MLRCATRHRGRNPYGNSHYTTPRATQSRSLAHRIALIRRTGTTRRDHHPLRSSQRSAALSQHPAALAAPPYGAAPHRDVCTRRAILLHCTAIRTATQFCRNIACHPIAGSVGRDATKEEGKDGQDTQGKKPSGNKEYLNWRSAGCTDRAKSLAGRWKRIRRGMGLPTVGGIFNLDICRHFSPSQGHNFMSN